tara:strand:- start:1401 stop:2099 length:699 start_codon:yes stop_codon:yes gene_type:complete
MYRFKLKEIEVGDTEIRGGKKSTVTDIDPETGAISWDVADVADFTSTYKALQQARDFLDTLEKTGKSKNDTTIDQFSEEIANLFNAFRTHVRKNYPKEYERVSRLKEEEIDEGEGIGYLTPRAFAKNKKSTGAPDIYYYKLGYKPVPKKIKGAGTIVKQLFEYNDFQQKRINVFSEIEDKINNILPMLSNAKNETAEFYNENPGSYAIVVPTDYILEILDEVELKLKQVQDK